MPWPPDMRLVSDSESKPDDEDKIISESMEGELGKNPLNVHPANRTITHDRMPKPIYVIYGSLTMSEVAFKTKATRSLGDDEDYGYTVANLVPTGVAPTFVLAAFTNNLERDNTLELLRKFSGNYSEFLAFFAGEITPV